MSIIYSIYKLDKNYRSASRLRSITRTSLSSGLVALQSVVMKSHKSGRCWCLIVIVFQITLFPLSHTMDHLQQYTMDCTQQYTPPGNSGDVLSFPGSMRKMLRRCLHFKAISVFDRICETFMTTDCRATQARIEGSPRNGP